MVHLSIESEKERLHDKYTEVVSEGRKEKMKIIEYDRREKE